MARIKHAVSTRRRKKRVLKRAKGQFGQRSRRYQQALRSIAKGMMYAYRDRRVKKRDFRRLWVARINAACRDAGMNYSRFMRGLANAKVTINRQALAELAVHSPVAFKRLVKVSQEYLAKTPAKKPAVQKEKK